MPERTMEAELAPGITLRGTADVASLGRDAAAVLDWKASWRPSEHPFQLMGYALLSALLTGLDEVMAIEVWLRPGTLRVHRWSRSDLDAYARRIVEQSHRIGDQWGPGPGPCKYCPLQLTCRARADYVQGAVTALAPMAGNRYPVSRELVADLWDRRTELRRALDRFDAVADAMLAEGGPIDLDDGRRLELQESERDTLIPSRAIPYLREVLELKPLEADQCLRLSKSALCEVLKARVPKGRGAAAIREAMAALKERDAIEKTIHREKRVVRR